MITETQLIDKITESFIKNEIPAAKTIKPCRIKWMGKFIRTNSRKTVWRSVGHAKSALRQHFSASRLYQDGQYNNWMSIERILCLMKAKKEYVPESRAIYHEFLQFLQDRKFLQFVEVDFEIFAQFSK